MKYLQLLLIIIISSIIINSQELEFEQINGFYGGKINHIEVDKRNDIIFATRRGRIIQYSSFSQDWKNISKNLPYQELSSIVSNSNNDYFVVGDNYKNSYGIFLKKNNSSHWTKIIESDKRITDIAIDSSDRIYLTTGLFLLRSEDNGNVWDTIRVAESENGFSEVMCFNNRIYVIDGGYSLNKIFVSEDNGGTWRKIWEPVGNFFDCVGKITNNGMNDIICIHIKYDNSDFVYSVLRITNEGEVWEEYELQFVPIEFIYKGNEVVSCTEGNIYRSTNNGKNWHYFSDGINVSEKFTAIAKTAGGKYVLGSDNGRIYTKNDIESDWIQINAYSLNTNNVSKVFTFGNTLFAVGSDFKIYRSENLGKTWLSLYPSPFNKKVMDVVVYDNRLLASIYANGIYYSDDLGDSWNKLSTDSLDNMTLKSIRIYHGDIWANTDHNLYLSSDGGNHWQNKTKSIKDVNFIITSVDFTEDSTIFIADNVSDFFEGGIYRSNDYGSTWDRVFQGIISRLYVDYKGALWFTDGGYDIFLSNDNCTTWTQILGSEGGPSNYLSAFSNPNIGIVISSYSNLCISQDDGKNWEKHQVTGANSINLDDDNHLLLGTSFGVIRSLSPLITGVENDLMSTTKDEFNLIQNYPNPFNPETKINYSLPQYSHVSIKVYDSIGRLVQILVNKYQNMGSYSIIFDGSELSSGVYFYRIETDDYSSAKKMVLLK